ncbi:MAG: hypothetical protein GX349_00855 [Firmicutes bacterium]|nr:hypothetical protein [Bacillota bacterium]
MAEGKVQILLEELYRLVETVAEGVVDNSRRLDLLTAEISKVKEGQTRLELLIRHMGLGDGNLDSFLPFEARGRRKEKGVLLGK